MDHDKIICVYCKREAEMMASNDTTVVIRGECGTALELETYEEFFDNRIPGNLKKMDSFSG
jgi:hypothetical protein